jgi:hypothetical protein
LVNILILRLCNYDKSPDHVESAGKFTLTESSKMWPHCICLLLLTRSGCLVKSKHVKLQSCSYFLCWTPRTVCYVFCLFLFRLSFPFSVILTQRTVVCFDCVHSIFCLNSVHEKNVYWTIMFSGPFLTLYGSGLLLFF